MKIFQEINDLLKKVDFFYLFERILTSIILSINTFLFLKYLYIRNPYIPILTLLISYFLYKHLRKSPNFEKIILNSDRHFNLEERLITFWEYREYNEPYGLMEKLILELENKLSNRSLKSSYKWKPSKFLIIITILMVMLIVLNILSSYTPIQKTQTIYEKENIEQELSLKLQENPSSKIQISKNIPGEKISEEKRDKEKSIAEKEKDKILEKLLSEWDFEEEKLMEEFLQKKTTSSSNEKNTSLKNQEEKDILQQEGISKNYMDQKSAFSRENVNKEFKSDEGISQGNLGIESQESREGLTKDEGIKDLNIDSSYNKPEKDLEAKGSLPGIEERKEKLGSKPTPRLNVEAEKVYVPSQGMDESKKKIYLFEAPSLKEEKNKVITTLNPSIISKNEYPTYPRVIPQDLQEIIKSYFSE